MSALNTPQTLRQQEICLIQQRIQEQQIRLTWSRPQILAVQEQALRQLLAYAKEHSPWHQARLAEFDTANIKLNQLSSLPTMTKKELMANWDNIVTDRKITLAAANNFLSTTKQPEYFLDRYHAYATGGSSGTRGVFVWNQESFINFVSLFFRYQFRDDYAKWDGKERIVLAVIAADHPIHMSTPIFSVPLLPAVEVHLTPATWPLQQLVAELNIIKPTHLIGYTSVLHRLAEQAAKGKLSFKPRRVSVNSEPLFPETLSLFKKVWNVPINNMWASTDGGPHAGNCDYTDDLHLNEDAVIVEVEAEKIFLTNLINPLAPLIRYEIDDQVVLSEQHCPCGSNYRLIKRVTGRMDDDFIYENAIMIPTEDFESVLYAIPQLEEYQIFQTPNGADIFIVANDPIDTTTITTTLEKNYLQKGFLNPELNIKLVKQLQRHAETGKLRRFVPLQKQ
jgi:phenylacetate-CoA ligase